MLKEFKQFLLRGNVIDLAVGVMVGAAFTSVVNSLVSDVLTPLISALARVPDYSSLGVTLNGTVVPYGKAINALISFVIVATAIFFFIVKPTNLLISRARKEPTLDPTTRKCPECLSEIPIAATRCSFCTQPVA